jgi:hypothetical protein
MIYIFLSGPDSNAHICAQIYIHLPMILSYLILQRFIHYHPRPHITSLPGLDWFDMRAQTLFRVIDTETSYLAYAFVVSQNII